jgi:hypothetical protein
MSAIKIKDRPDLVQEEYSTAVLNSSVTALEIYKANRKKSVEIQAAIEEINSLKEDMKDIKLMLQQVIEIRN